MNIIKLNSKKYPELVALVDSDSYALASKHKWNLLDSNRNGSVFYAFSRIDGKSTVLHKFLFGLGLDHINGDGLDCRKENLRPATRKQQAQNRRFTKNKTGYMGVYLQRPGKYQASIRVDGRNKSLGYFSTAEEASVIREAKAKELFGEFYRKAG